MSDDEKTCPRCAEMVKAAALVCRHCGHEFGGERAAAIAGAPTEIHVEPARKRFKKRWIAGTVAALFVISALAGADPDAASTAGKSAGAQTDADGAASTAAENASGATAEPEDATLTVSARTLAAAFEANEVAAMQTYGDQPLRVTGRVASVALDFSNDAVIALEGSNQFLNVQASLDEESQARVASIGKGQTMTVTCEGLGEAIGMAMLRDCALS